MGNCVFKNYYNNTTASKLVDHNHSDRRQQYMLAAKQTSMIKVVTTTGGIMELYAPITVEQITSEFPNHGLFLNPNPTHPALLHNEILTPGHLYYLLPLSISSPTDTTLIGKDSVLATPYRMSVDVGTRMMYKNQPDPDVVPKYNGTGVWKVRLVINPEQLSEILSQDNKTQQLIESVRTVAKCGSGSTSNSCSSTSGVKTGSLLSSSSSLASTPRSR
ncbi:unnamed protein product [Amaranthus hypochondriacus]